MIVQHPEANIFFLTSKFHVCSYYFMHTYMKAYKIFEKRRRSKSIAWDGMATLRAGLGTMSDGRMDVNYFYVFSWTKGGITPRRDSTPEESDVWMSWCRTWEPVDSPLNMLKTVQSGIDWVEMQTLAIKAGTNAMDKKSICACKYKKKMIQDE